jgi:hypothetical protein
MAHEPGRATIKKRGGEAKVAAIAGAVLSAPYRWQPERSSGGTGGPILRAYHRGLPDDADGIVLAAQEFLIPRAGAVSRTE